MRNNLFLFGGRMSVCLFSFLYITLLILSARTAGEARKINLEMYTMRTEVTRLETKYYNLSQNISSEDFNRVGMAIPTEQSTKYLTLGPRDEISSTVVRR